MTKKNILSILGLTVVCLVVSAGVSRAQSADELYKQANAMLKESLDEKSVTESLKLLEQAAELDPGNEEVWIRISWNYFLLGDDLEKDLKEERRALFEKGKAAGEKAMQINNRSSGGMYWYTVNLASAGEMKGILSSLSLAGELFSNINRIDRRDPYYYYGATRRFGSEIFVRVPTWLTERFGFKAEYIEEDLLMNIEKWPNFFDNYTYLARVYVWSGQMEKALEMLEFVLSHSPDIMPEERAENAKQQEIAKEMWKEYTGKEYPEK